MTELDLAKHLTYLLEQQLNGVDNSNDIELFKLKYESKYPNIYSLAYEKAKLNTIHENAEKVEALGNIPNHIKIIFDAYQQSDFRLVRVYGDSMIDANINDGDYCIVNTMVSPNNLDIAIMEYRDRTFIKKYHNKSDKIVLKSANKDYPDIEVDNKDSLKIIGVVVSLLKNI